MTTLSTIEMERAYLSGDATYNGLFSLAVRTTGIFCRPTCPARKPLPKNVEYFGSTADALAAGYRPCKRCRPLDWGDEPAWAAELRADLERDPQQRIGERDLRARGIDPATARRYFLRRYGMTFLSFARARRLSSALQRIRRGQSLDATVFDSGYASHSGFRDAFQRVFGTAPGRSRERDYVRLGWLQSPLGPLVAGATDDGICLLEFTDRRMLEAQFTSLRRRFGAPLVPGTHSHLQSLEIELAAYFAGTLRKFTVPLVYPGSTFQQRVWQQLLTIPYGETQSYEQLAMVIDHPTAVRAVGRANGQNRIAILIPCHRVVNKNGELGGYGGGLRRKQFLLDLELFGSRPSEG